MFAFLNGLDRKFDDLFAADFGGEPFASTHQRHHNRRRPAKRPKRRTTSRGSNRHDVEDDVSDDEPILPTRHRNKRAKPSPKPKRAKNGFITTKFAGFPPEKYTTLPEGENKCGICLSDVDTNTVYVTTVCEHIFCLTCLQTWEKTQRAEQRDKFTCPTCRESLIQN